MRLIRLFLVVIGTLFGAMLAIHLIGGLYPNPMAVLFTNPDGSPCQMPCLFGVRPGQMTVDEGLEILDKHRLTHGMEFDHSRSTAIGSLLDNKETFVEIISDDHKQIAEIVLGYNFGTNPEHLELARPELVSALNQGFPGSQAVYFGTVRDDFLITWAVLPIGIERCYAGDTVCFNNIQSDRVRPWQLEPFQYLIVYGQSPH